MKYNFVAKHMNTFNKPKVEETKKRKERTTREKLKATDFSKDEDFVPDHELDEGTLYDDEH